MDQELYWLNSIQEALRQLTLLEPTAIAECGSAMHHLTLAENHLTRLDNLLNPPSDPTQTYTPKTCTSDGTYDYDEIPF